MLIPLLLLASPAAPTAAGPPDRKDPPIHVWFNDDGRYDYGDRAKVYVLRGTAEAPLLPPQLEEHPVPGGEKNTWPLHE